MITGCGRARAARALAVLACAVSAAVAVPGKGQASWWIRNHGAVSADDEPLAGRAQEIFSRVAAAADKRGNRPPRLVVVRGGGDPFAVAIEDGTIVLALPGLRACYRDVAPAEGDARLAFLLGHELAHLARDDFWHLAAFTAVEEHEADPATRRALLDLIRSGSDLGSDEDAAGAARLKELQADSHGLVYMMMAGFDPQALVARPSGFLAEWTGQVTGRLAWQDPTHPDPDHRVALLRAQLDSVFLDLDFFHFGVRLFQLGRYEDALLLLGRFAERFPSREVFSNMGLAHYQLAARALAACDPGEAVRYRLSVQLDPDTLAAPPRLPGRSGRPAGCRDLPPFRSHIRSAVEHLDRATASDPSHLPSRINLAAAHLLAGAPTLAMGVLDQAPAAGGDSPDARNNRAVALHLFGRESSIDTIDQSLRILEAILEDHPGHPGATYNLAALESQRGRHAAARLRWERFLEAEPSGPWADRARRLLGSGGEDIPPARVTARSLRPPAQPPIALGAPPAAAGLAGAVRRRPFRIGIFRGEFLSIGDARALRMEEYVEVVETDLRPSLPRERILARYGPPQRSVPGTTGETLVYPGFALDVRDGHAGRIVFFEPGPR